MGLWHTLLEWLVVAMTDSSNTDYLREMVLLLHPRFCSSVQLVRALVRRFELVDGALSSSAEEESGHLKPDSLSTEGLSDSILGMVGVAQVERMGTSKRSGGPPAISRSRSLPLHERLFSRGWWSRQCIG